MENNKEPNWEFYKELIVCAMKSQLYRVTLEEKYKTSYNPDFGLEQGADILLGSFKELFEWKDKEWKEKMIEVFESCPEEEEDFFDEHITDKIVKWKSEQINKLKQL